MASRERLAFAPTLRTSLRTTYPRTPLYPPCSSKAAPGSKTGPASEERRMTIDLDFDSIDGIDDADDKSLLLLIKDRTSGDYGWHWVYRDTLADHGLHDLADLW